MPRPCRVGQESENFDKGEGFRAHKVGYHFLKSLQLGGGGCSIPVGPVCGSGTSSISIAWELVGSANSQPSPEPETD